MNSTVFITIIIFKII